VFEDIAASGLLTLIADQRRSLRDIVEGRDESAIARRPVSGKWSALENIRHLLFAEQAHLGRYAPGGQQWSSLGYTPQTMREARNLSRNASPPLPSLSEVMAAWDELHLAIVGALATQDSPAVRAALSRNLKHLRAHCNVVQHLVREA
jgi:DNA-binding GntR family transcriptional regulator